MFTEAAATTGDGGLAADPAGSLATSPSSLLLVFLGFHIPLALLLNYSSMLATIHALATFMVGLVWVASTQDAARIIYIAAYITGAEVLWRMTGASIFWESGKYIVALLLVVTMLRQKRLGQARLGPMFYFLFLVPSAVFVFDREALSFNLSGPFSLAVAAMFFSTVTLGRIELKHTLLAIVAPGVSIATLTLYGILTAPHIAFVNESMFVTSGGYGPNQVSSALGFGVLAAFLYAATYPDSWLLRLTVGGAGLWMAIQAVLTFSRGGILAAAVAILMSVFYLVRSSRTRGIVLTVGAVLLLVGALVLLPALDGFTDGLLETRFGMDEIGETTGRDLIAAGDWMAFRENPVTGTGPGQSRRYHAVTFGKAVAPHTEFSRVLAEHGVLGMLSLLILIALSIGRFLKEAPPTSKACTAAFTVWTLLFMLHSAMRLVAPSFAFGLAAASIACDEG